MCRHRENKISHISIKGPQNTRSATEDSEKSVLQLSQECIHCCLLHTTEPSLMAFVVCVAYSLKPR